MAPKKKILVLTGAGISAESGVATFRDANGLWENHDIMDMASIDGWNRNPELVLDFYNQRRRQLKSVFPNAAHRYLKQLEERYEVVVVTQNVDDLHERAGSTRIIHLHGRLDEVRSERSEHLISNWLEDLNLGDLASDGAQLRPNIVWFGEMVPAMAESIVEAANADVMLIIGTSLQVYPAASLVDYVPHGCPIYVIDPNAVPVANRATIRVIQKSATAGVLDLDL